MRLGPMNRSRFLINTNSRHADSSDDGSEGDELATDAVFVTEAKKGAKRRGQKARGSTGTPQPSPAAAPVEREALEIEYETSADGETTRIRKWTIMNREVDGVPMFHVQCSVRSYVSVRNLKVVPELDHWTAEIDTIKDDRHPDRSFMHLPTTNMRYPIRGTGSDGHNNSDKMQQWLSENAQSTNELDGSVTWRPTNASGEIYTYTMNSTADSKSVYIFTAAHRRDVAKFVFIKHDNESAARRSGKWEFECHNSGAGNHGFYVKRWFVENDRWIRDDAFDGNILRPTLYLGNSQFWFGFTGFYFPNVGYYDVPRADMDGFREWLQKHAQVTVEVADGGKIGVEAARCALAGWTAVERAAAASAASATTAVIHSKSGKFYWTVCWRQSTDYTGFRVSKHEKGGDNSDVPFWFCHTITLSFKPKDPKLVATYVGMSRKGKDKVNLRIECTAEPDNALKFADDMPKSGQLSYVTVNTTGLKTTWTYTIEAQAGGGDGGGEAAGGEDAGGEDAGGEAAEGEAAEGGNSGSKGSSRRSQSDLVKKLLKEAEAEEVEARIPTIEEGGSDEERGEAAGGGGGEEEVDVPEEENDGEKGEFHLVGPYFQINPGKVDYADATIYSECMLRALGLQNTLFENFLLPLSYDKDTSESWSKSPPKILKYMMDFEEKLKTLFSAETDTASGRTLVMEGKGPPGWGVHKERNVGEPEKLACNGMFCDYPSGTQPPGGYNVVPGEATCFRLLQLEAHPRPTEFTRYTVCVRCLGMHDDVPEDYYRQLVFIKSAKQLGRENSWRERDEEGEWDKVIADVIKAHPISPASESEAIQSHEQRDQAMHAAIAKFSESHENVGKAQFWARYSQKVEIANREAEIQRQPDPEQATLTPAPQEGPLKFFQVFIPAEEHNLNLVWPLEMTWESAKKQLQVDFNLGDVNLLYLWYQEEGVSVSLEKVCSDEKSFQEMKNMLVQDWGNLRAFNGQVKATVCPVMRAEPRRVRENSPAFSFGSVAKRIMGEVEKHKDEMLTDFDKEGPTRFYHKFSPTGQEVKIFRRCKTRDWIWWIFPLLEAPQNDKQAWCFCKSVEDYFHLYGNLAYKDRACTCMRNISDSYQGLLYAANQKNLLYLDESRNPNANYISTGMCRREVMSHGADWWRIARFLALMLPLDELNIEKLAEWHREPNEGRAELDTLFALNLKEYGHHVWSADDEDVLTELFALYTLALEHDFNAYAPDTHHMQYTSRDLRDHAKREAMKWFGRAPPVRSGHYFRMYRIEPTEVTAFVESCKYDGWRYSGYLTQAVIDALAMSFQTEWQYFNKDTKTVYKYLGTELATVMCAFGKHFVPTADWDNYGSFQSLRLSTNDPKRPHTVTQYPRQEDGSRNAESHEWSWYQILNEENCVLCFPFSLAQVHWAMFVFYFNGGFDNLNCARIRLRDSSPDLFASASFLTRIQQLLKNVEEVLRRITKGSLRFPRKRGGDIDYDTIWGEQGPNECGIETANSWYHVLHDEAGYKPNADERQIPWTRDSIIYRLRKMPEYTAIEDKLDAEKQKRKKQKFDLSREERDLQEALERSRNDVMGQPAAVDDMRDAEYISSFDEEEQVAELARYEALQDAKHGAHLQGAATNADARAAAAQAAARRRVSWENYGRPREKR